uniref:Cocaine- and amphetamine-regulated transcript 2 n=1 Tax=Oncorhynchus tshawytscha TaxID=74940 RepID=A0A8C8I259_ONCTS
MESSKLWTRAIVCTALLSILCGAETSDSEMEVDLETRNIHDFYPQNPNLTNEKRLLGALHEVLKKLQTKRINPWEKKFGQVPTVRFYTLSLFREVRRGGALRSEERCSNRQNVRLSTGSFLQLLSVEVLVNGGLLDSIPYHCVI